MSVPLAPWRLKVIRSIIGTLSLGIGILLAWAGYFHQLPKYEQVASWVKTPCQILRWSVEVSRSTFGTSVDPSMAFEYVFNGKTYTSGNYDEMADEEVDFRDFEAEGVSVRKSPTFCYVNPAQPYDASFHPVQLWFPYSLIGGGTLLALGGFVFLCRTFLGRAASRPLEQRWRGLGRWGLTIGGLICGAIGWNLADEQNLLDLFYAPFVQGQMIQVPAKVETTGISIARGRGRRSHMTYHMANLAYSYEHSGHRWVANRWYFDTTQLNGGSQEETETLLRQYPQGMNISVWIHPEKPWIATFYRGVGWQHLYCLPTLILIGFATWMLWMAVRLGQRHH